MYLAAFFEVIIMLDLTSIINLTFLTLHYYLLISLVFVFYVVVGYVYYVNNGRLVF